MKIALLAVGLVASLALADTNPPPKVLSIDVSNKRPVQLSTNQELASYATQNNYYYSVNIKAGMRVLFSASYGIGGEAAQAEGVVVEKNGHFFYQQQGNPSSNLLLPPGLSLDSQDGVSLWDLGAYMDLINRVAFSQSNASWATSNDVWSSPQAAMVDFRGGTAGQSVFYQDALEVDFSKSFDGRGSTANWSVYYGKNIGPVALEFNEDMEPAGTFKFYLGN
jgi:hypothetical protein